MTRALDESAGDRGPALRRAARPRTPVGARRHDRARRRSPRPSRQRRHRDRSPAAGARWPCRECRGHRRSIGREDDEMRARPAGGRDDGVERRRIEIAPRRRARGSPGRSAGPARGRPRRRRVRRALLRALRHRLFLSRRPRGRSHRAAPRRAPVGPDSPIRRWSGRWWASVGPARARPPRDRYPAAASARSTWSPAASSPTRPTTWTAAPPRRNAAQSRRSARPPRSRARTAGRWDSRRRRSRSQGTPAAGDNVAVRLRTETRL